MQILELLFVINGLKKCKGTSLCTWYVIFALFTHFFYISKTDKILPFFSQFSRKFLQHFWGNRFTCMCHAHFSIKIVLKYHNVTDFLGRKVVHVKDQHFTWVTMKYKFKWAIFRMRELRIIYRNASWPSPQFSFYSLSFFAILFKAITIDCNCSPNVIQF